MRFRVLGPLQVWDGAVWSPVRAPQQRVVLAVLLAEAGRVVSRERIIDEVWPEDPPPAAVPVVQGYITRLRRLLGGERDSLLVTQGGGYRLALADDDVDERVFRALVGAAARAGEAGRPDEALGCLSDALVLWRGEPFADVPPGPGVAAAASQLRRARVDAVQRRLGVLADLGRDADVVAEAERALAEDRAHEGLYARLMAALYRCGRRAEALDVYRQARTVLVEEYGLEPGPELRGVHEQVLADDPRLVAAAATVSSDAPPPAQLPGVSAAFTGRGEQLGWLSGLLPGEAPVRPGPVVATVAGAAGVGKTALALYWAHRVRPRFPDGQLYVDLRGYGPVPPLRPIDALAALLAALGVRAADVPADPDQAASMYRSRLADRRVLILLDNARQSDQVRPLLPGGTGCLVLVTSRDQLRGLSARDGAVLLDLDVLPPGDAHVLLERLLGAGRVAAEPAAIPTLARLCGYLPLALRIAAANLNANPALDVAGYTAQLHSGRVLDALQVAGDPEAAVRTTFDHSYAALPAPAQRLFRFLGVAPGPDVTADAAGALLDAVAEDAARLLDILASAHLVTRQPGGAYLLHDLLRVYAAEKGATDDEAPAAVDRLHGYYLRHIDAAAAVLYPHLLRLPGARPDSAASFPDEAAARRWLDRERPNLVAAVVHAAEHGPNEAAWRLTDALRGYFGLVRSMVEWETVATAGLAAAERDADLYGQAAVHVSLATLRAAQDDHDQTLHHYTCANDLARRAGWLEAQSAAVNNLSNVLSQQGRLEEAARRYQEALEIDRGIGSLPGQAAKLGNLAIIRFSQGQLERAAELCREALALDRKIGSGEATTLENLGEACLALGRFDEATACLAEALSRRRELADTRGLAMTCRARAELDLELGHDSEALDLATEALRLARETDARMVEAEALNTLGRIQNRRHDHRLAAGSHRAALALAVELGAPYPAVAAHLGLAAALCHSGAVDDAAEHGEHARSVARHRGYRMFEAHALTVLAEIQLRRGQPERAVDDLEAALARYRDCGHRPGESRAQALLERAGRPR